LSLVRDGMQSAFQELPVTFGLPENLSVPWRAQGTAGFVWHGLEAISTRSGDRGDPGCRSPVRDPGTYPGNHSDDGAGKLGGGCGQAVTDTIKESNDGRFVERTLERSRLLRGADGRKRSAAPSSARLSGSAPPRVSR